MGGIGALRAEVLHRVDDAGAEVHLPQAIHEDAGGQRVLLVEQPIDETQAIRRKLAPSVAKTRAGTPGCTSLPRWL